MKAPIGSTIFTMNVVDPDLGKNAVLEYDIVNGTIDIPFSVTRTTGKIILAAPVDYETITIYHVSLLVTVMCNYRVNPLQMYCISSLHS